MAKNAYLCPRLFYFLARLILPCFSPCFRENFACEMADTEKCVGKVENSMQHGNLFIFGP